MREAAAIAATSAVRAKMLGWEIINNSFRSAACAACSTSEKMTFAGGVSFLYSTYLGGRPAVPAPPVVVDVPDDPDV
jgi:hypothetical protein